MYPRLPRSAPKLIKLLRALDAPYKNDGAFLRGCGEDGHDGKEGVGLCVPG